MRLPTLTQKLGYLWVHTNNSVDEDSVEVGMLLDDGASVSTVDGIEAVSDFIKANIKVKA